SGEWEPAGRAAAHVCEQRIGEDDREQDEAESCEERVPGLSMQGGVEIILCSALRHSGGGRGGRLCLARRLELLLRGGVRRLGSGVGSLESLRRLVRFERCAIGL